MKNILTKSAVILALATVNLFTPVLATELAPGTLQTLVPLSNHVPDKNIKNSQDVGAVSGTKSIKNIHLVLKQSGIQNSKLKQFLADQQNPHSPSYHHWITSSQYGKLYGVDDYNIQQAIKWLTAAGFKNARVNAAKTDIEFDGTAQSVVSTFKTPLRRFVQNGKEYYSNTQNPLIPASLKEHVAGIRGLSNFSINSKPNYVFDSNQQLAFTPTDIAKQYNFTSAYTTGLNGKGSTIALIAMSKIDPTILSQYLNNFGIQLAQPITTIPVYGEDPGQTLTDLETEAFLDVEVVATLAPGAKITLVADQDFLDGLAYAINNNVAGIINVPFEIAELDMLLNDKQFTENVLSLAAAQGITVLASAGDSGVASLDAQSGHAAFDGLSVNAMAASPYTTAIGATRLNAILSNNKSNSPTFGSITGYTSESVWNQTCTYIASTYNESPSAYCNASTAYRTTQASGGGLSNCASIDNSNHCLGGQPAPAWQTNVLGIGNWATRAVPDIAFLGENFVMCDYRVTTCDLSKGAINQNFFSASGTSISAPIATAMVALLDQGQVSASNPDGRVGLINPLLYQLAHNQYSGGYGGECDSAKGSNISPQCIFNDITVGDNSVPCRVSYWVSYGGVGTCYAPNSTVIGISYSNNALAYLAGQGYDLASGLGSLNVANFIAAAQTLVAPSGLSVKPSGQGQVTLTWTPVNQVTNYQVFMSSVAGKSSQSAPVASTAGNSATVSGLVSGQTYYFSVMATSKNGTSAPANEVSQIIPPMAPTGISTSSSEQSITLKFSPSASASSYSIYQGDSSQQESTKASITGLTTNSAAISGLIPGKIYYFEVTAVNAGGESVPSTEVSQTVVANAPTELQALSGHQQVTLTWSPAAGAVSYNIYQGTSAQSMGTTPIATDLKGTYNVVTGLTPQTVYYFTVTATNAGGESAPSNVANAIPSGSSTKGGGGIDWLDLAILIGLGVLDMTRRKLLSRTLN